jgi:hypothetical protein
MRFMRSLPINLFARPLLTLCVNNLPETGKRQHEKQRMPFRAVQLRRTNSRGDLPPSKSWLKAIRI